MNQINFEKIFQNAKKMNINNDIVDVKKISQGISLQTYRLFLSNNDTFIFKCPKNPSDIVSIKRLKWQFDVQKYLNNFLPVPEPIYYYLGKDLAGMPFIVMQDIVGTPGNSIKDTMPIELLIKLHKIDIDSFLNLHKYPKVDLNKYLNTLINQYQTRKTGTEVDKIINWLSLNLPKQQTYSFIHNDWKMDNLLFYKKNISAIIDWEISQISDPRVDLGISMSYWEVSNELKNQVIFQYFNEMNLDYESWQFFEVLGIFRQICMAKLIEHKKFFGNIELNEYADVYDKIHMYINKCERIIAS